MRNITILALLGIMCLSCTTPKFYTELQTTDGRNLNININRDMYGITLKAFEKELKDSNHIIYIHLPGYTGLTYDVVEFVYDVENSKYYKLVFSENGKIKKMYKNTYSKDSFEVFLLENYLNGNKEYITELSEELASSAKTYENNIYDINLKTGQYTKFRFSSFPFEDGKPYFGFGEFND